ncbi:MAG: hypothetical protein ACFFAO_17405 [Candidatus Hermodarchaeota archaeon]
MSKNCNAVIIYLSRKQDIKDLKKSLNLLDKYFNKKYTYPIIIFHDDFSDEDKNFFLDKYPNLKFEYIKFKIPPWIDRNKIFPGNIGYNHMCRFFSGELFKHKAIKKYEWYWRLDSDSFFHSKIKYDIFKYMEKNNYIYGYLGERLLKDSPDFVIGLWELTEKYIKNKDINPKYLHEYLDEGGKWDRSLYYTNFEVSNLNFWRSDEYQDYYNVIDKNGGIYYNRWGDASIHLLAVSVFVDKNKVYCFKDIDYSHQDFRPNRKSYILKILTLRNYIRSSFNFSKKNV